MLIHALKLKQLLKLGTVSRLFWIDTRDMVANGLNKGIVPTVRFDSIVVLADGRCCIGPDGVGFAPSNEDLVFRAGVCHLMNLFLRTIFNLRHGPIQF